MASMKSMDSITCLTLMRVTSEYAMAQSWLKSLQCTSLWRDKVAMAQLLTTSETLSHVHRKSTRLCTPSNLVTSVIALIALSQSAISPRVQLTMSSLTKHSSKVRFELMTMKHKQGSWREFIPSRKTQPRQCSVKLTASLDHSTHRQSITQLRLNTSEGWLRNGLGQSTRPITTCQWQRVKISHTSCLRSQDASSCLVPWSLERFQRHSTPQITTSMMTSLLLVGTSGSGWSKTDSEWALFDSRFQYL